MSQPLTFGTFTLRPDTGEATWPEGGAHLNRKECALLVLLLSDPEQPKSKQALMEHLWGDELAGSKNRLSVTLHRLKEKVAFGDGAPLTLSLTRGKGYWLQTPQTSVETSGLSLSGGILDLERSRFLRGDTATTLTEKETRLLQFLNRTPNTYCEPEALLAHLWGRSAAEKARGLKTVLYRCRQKIETEPVEPTHLLSKYGGQIGLFYEVKASEPVPETVESPQSLLPLIGRVELMHHLKQALSQGSRCLTLTGPGGLGKTRLAWALMDTEEVADLFGDGIAFCDLATCQTGGDIIKTVATDLGLVPPVQRTQTQQAVALGHALAARSRQLLVLDNAEHLVEVGRELLSVWIRLAPQTQFVVTSRRQLGLAAEQIVALAPLTLDAMMTLFLNQAQRVCPTRRLSPQERRRLAAILERLEGNALASVLCAGQIGTGDFDAWSTAWETGEQNTALLTDVIGRSWDLLTSEEQTVLDQLCAVRDGVTLEMGEAVFWTETEWVDEVLEHLIAHSLVRVQIREGRESRLVPYESVREFTRTQSGSRFDQTALQQRIIEYYVDQLRPYREKVHKLDLIQLGAEAYNLWQALEWAVDCTADGVLELMMLTFTNALSNEQAQRWLEIVEMNWTGDALLRGLVLQYRLTTLDAWGRHEDSQALRAQLIDDPTIHPQYRQMFESQSVEKQYEVDGNLDAWQAYLQETLAQLPEEALAVRSAILSNLARVYRYRGDIDNALDHYQASADAYDRGGLRWDLQRELNIAMTLLTGGLIAEAQEAFTAILPKMTDGTLQHMGPDAHGSLATIAFFRGAYEEATHHLQQALSYCSFTARPNTACWLNSHLAMGEFLLGHPESAADRFTRYPPPESPTEMQGAEALSHYALFRLHCGEPEEAEALWGVAESVLATHSTLDKAAWRGLWDMHRAVAETEDPAVCEAAAALCECNPYCVPRQPVAKQHFCQPGIPNHWLHVILLEEWTKKPTRP